LEYEHEQRTARKGASLYSRNHDDEYRQDVSDEQPAKRRDRSAGEELKTAGRIIEEVIRAYDLADVHNGVCPDQPPPAVADRSA